MEGAGARLAPRSPAKAASQQKRHTESAMTHREFVPVIAHLRAAAERRGARPAFVGRDAISYTEFYGRTRRWAGRFRAAGLSEGGRVAIWLPKRRDYVTALYAAMEAGGAYVPLDGAQPAARARKILADAAPAVLVTDRARFATLEGPAIASLRLVILVDGPGEGRAGVPPFAAGALVEDAAALDCAPPLETPFAPDPGDLAAIFFTSGSTGAPKGVKISHGNLAHFIGWSLSEFALSERDVFASHAGFHFDISTFDLFAAAAAGGAVWIIGEDAQRDAAALAGGVVLHGVTVWYSAPSALTLMTASGALDAARARALRYVLFAGEVFPIRHMCALKRMLQPDCGLYNLYGPTETNVCAFYRTRDSDLARDRPVCIGEPLPGIAIELVGEDGLPARGAGAIGEIVVSGPCVTPGYANVVDPRNHENHQQGRHATGDLATWEDGRITYLGRKDRMVKIHGARVELGEIEAALATLPGVREAAVVAVTTGTETVVAAFYSLEPDAPRPGLIAIKQHCRERLPRYMIPRSARRLDALPRNANGKTDYLALAALARPDAPAPPDAAPAASAHPADKIGA